MKLGRPAWGPLRPVPAPSRGCLPNVQICISGCVPVSKFPLFIKTPVVLGSEPFGLQCELILTNDINKNSISQKAAFWETTLGPGQTHLGELHSTPPQPVFGFQWMQETLLGEGASLGRGAGGGARQSGLDAPTDVTLYVRWN